MVQRRRGIFASFGSGFRDGYNRHSAHHVHRGYRQSFIARQDAAYHRNKHRRHAMKHLVLGTVGFVILLCICGSFIGLW